MARPAAEGILVYRQVPGMRGSWPRRTGAGLLRDGPFLQATQGDGREQVAREACIVRRARGEVLW